MALTGTIQIAASFIEVAALAARVAEAKPRLSKTLTLLDGAGVGLVNKIFQPATDPAVAASTNTDYDLSGTLAGSFGNVVFTGIKAIIVMADDTNPGPLTVFGGTNPFLGPLSGTTPSLALLPGQLFLVTRTDAGGWTVANSTNDNFRIASAATVGTYSWDLLLAGIG